MEHTKSFSGACILVKRVLQDVYQCLRYSICSTNRAVVHVVERSAVVRVLQHVQKYVRCSIWSSGFTTIYQLWLTACAAASVVVREFQTGALGV